MAYFPNGTSGMIYQDQYCENCRNWRDMKDDRGPGCPIWDLHLMMNRNQCKDTELGKLWKKALDHFIPMDKDDVYPKECRMFLPIENPDVPGQKKMF